MSVTLAKAAIGRKKATAIFDKKHQSLREFVDSENAATTEAAVALRQAEPIMSPARLRWRLIRESLRGFVGSSLGGRLRRQKAEDVIRRGLDAWFEFLVWAKYWALGRSASGLVADCGGESLGGFSGGGLEKEEALTASSPRARLSVVILTRNEEDKIARCLESVRWADEIIVVDGLSEDRTVEICRRFGARVVSHAFEGSFAQERNMGMERASGEWVLQIDADDVATPALRKRVEELLRRPGPHAAFKFRRRSILLGRVMRHGGWHYWLPNLVRRDQVRYEGLVHERPAFSGSIGRIDADVDHYPCENLHLFIQRQNRYTSLQAEELFRSRSAIPERELRLLLGRKPWKTFWKSYVKKAGYREGLHGLVFARLYAGIELLKWAKYWEGSRSKGADGAGKISIISRGFGGEERVA